MQQVGVIKKARMYQHANGARLDAASFAPDQAGQAQINQIRRGIGEIGAPVSVCSTGAKREDPAYPSAAAARHQCFFRGCRSEARGGGKEGVSTCSTGRGG